MGIMYRVLCRQGSSACFYTVQECRFGVHCRQAGVSVQLLFQWTGGGSTKRTHLGVVNRFFFGFLGVKKGAQCCVSTSTSRKDGGRPCHRKPSAFCKCLQVRRRFNSVDYLGTRRSQSPLMSVNQSVVGLCRLRVPQSAGFSVRFFSVAINLIARCFFCHGAVAASVLVLALLLTLSSLDVLAAENPGSVFCGCHQVLIRFDSVVYISSTAKSTDQSEASPTVPLQVSTLLLSWLLSWSWPCSSHCLRWQCELVSSGFNDLDPAFALHRLFFCCQQVLAYAATTSPTTTTTKTTKTKTKKTKTTTKKRTKKTTATL